MLDISLGEKKKEMTIARAQDAITMNDSTGLHQAQWPHSKEMMVVYKRRIPTPGPTPFPVPPTQFAWVLLYIIQVDACQRQAVPGKKVHNFNHWFYLLLLIESRARKLQIRFHPK